MTTPHTVWVLEDNREDATLIARALAKTGAPLEVRTLANRREFDDEVSAATDAGRSPVLVVSDNRIPGLHHLEALRAISGRWPEALFLLCSGGGNPQDEERAREEGALGMLRKPDLMQLPLIARAALEGAEARRRAQELEAAKARVERHDAGMRMLVEAVRDLSTARSRARIHEIVRDKARRLVGADGATVVLREGDQCYYAEEDAIEPAFKGQRYPMESCIGGWVMKNGQPAVIADVAADARIPIDAYMPTYIRSLVMVPVRKEAPLAAIGNYWSSSHEPTEDDVALLQALADSTAIAMENVALYESLEARVEERTKALNELNRELEGFSYTVSHDLRAPLRHISAFSQILKAEHGAQLPPAASDVVDRILRAAQRMSRMIEGMLELARHTQESMERREVDMNALVQDELDSRSGETRGVQLDVSALPPCTGDRVLLARVWSNLIGNALKYSSRSPSPRIAIDGGVAGAEAIYCVRDNGVGFDMQYADKLFGMFQRLHASGEFEGVGMGLAIVHKIIQRHGGRIWAEAKANGGATFCFALPAASGAASS